MNRFPRALVLTGKLLAACLLLVVVNGLGAELLPQPADASAPPPASFLGLVVGILLLQTLALAYPVIRSPWGTWHRIAAVAVLYFGSVTFLGQIETWAYMGDQLPAGMLRGLFLMGLFNAVVFAPLLVWILGRGGSVGQQGEAAPPRSASRGLPWPRLAIAAAVYLALYYLFGYYVAWQSEAVRVFYGGTDPGSFFDQLVKIARDTPWMLPFQYLRGFLWALLALLVLRLMEARRVEKALALALLFVVPCLYLLFPNPLMPEDVRYAHLAETVPYQLIFALFAAWFLDGAAARRRGRTTGSPASRATASSL